ncbi:MAG: trypsin-like peptidase domain-containing protein [Gammaproteobacteria bacterium]|nr:trypsin-like peptidase domain-containing protein [Gammaproteobacteria bacterium]
MPLLTWGVGGDGQHTAAVTFTAQGAVSLRVAVHVELPEGGSVRVFDGDGRSRGRSFTPEDFNADSVWLPSAEGDRLTVQFAVPSPDAVADLSFRVVSVAHRFASVIPKRPDCRGHVEIACITDRAKREKADAVGRILFEDGAYTYVCSGTLLNVSGTPDVFEPYFLTAHHCVGSTAAATTVEARWFWQKSNCSGIGDDRRSTYSFSGTNLLATSPAQDSSLLEFREALPGGLLYSGWATSPVSGGTSVFSIHHPGGYAAKYAEGRVVRIADFDLEGTSVYGMLETDWRRGLTEPGSSGAGLFLGDSGTLVGVLAGGDGECLATGDIFGPLRDFFPHVEQWLVPSSHEPETLVHALPAVPGADAAGGIHGLMRIVNFSDKAGEVNIVAIDNSGERRGPVTLELGALQAKHITSQDLENGNDVKGLRGGVGDGTGMWRLELSSELLIEALAYFRTPDGFLTSMQAVAAETEAGSNRYHVPFFNPGSNLGKRSLLRLINPGNTAASVVITGVDDAGATAPQGEVRLTLEPGTAHMVNARELEQGASGLVGRLGDGTGKWRLSVSSDTPLHVMSLLQLSTGHLTNLSRGSGSATAETPPAKWERSGIGDEIFDLPVRIERIRIEGEFLSFSELFTVWCGGPGDRGGLLVNEIIGTAFGETRYSGVHSARRRYGGRGEPCRELDIDGTGVRWTVSEVEVSSNAALSPAVGGGDESTDRLAVERARAKVLWSRGQSGHQLN